MKTRHSRLALLAGLLLAASVAHAQVVGYNFRTGDAWVDTRLFEVNDYGARYRDPFVDEMVGHYGAPRSLVADLFGRHWSAGDIFMACAIAHVLGQPCINVVHVYERDRGQGWGNVAKRMGIKPGSREFHALKNGFSSTYTRWGYPVSVGSNVHVDWSKHGPGNKGGKGRPYSQGHDDHGDHHGGKSHGKGKGKDKH